ncbi:MAG: hypothetical protein HYT87_02280 [Nitrospirae bacterium]|nr:hypothetical protein [Nitrospirota bacterium]
MIGVGSNNSSVRRPRSEAERGGIRGKTIAVFAASFVIFACSSGGGGTSSCGSGTPPPGLSAAPAPAVPNTLSVRLNNNVFDYAETVLNNFLSATNTKDAIKSLLSSTDALVDTCLSVPLIGNACVALFIEDADGDFSTDRNNDAACTSNEVYTDANNDKVWQKTEVFWDVAGKGFDHDSNAATPNHYWDPGETYIGCDTCAAPPCVWGVSACQDSGDTGLCKFKYYVLDCGPDGNCGQGAGNPGGGDDPADLPACTATQLYYDRDHNYDTGGVAGNPCDDGAVDDAKDAGDGTALDFTPDVRVTASLGPDGVADTMADITNKTVDDRINIVFKLNNFTLDMVAKPNPKADGCGKDLLCGCGVDNVCGNGDDNAAAKADDELDKFISYLSLGGKGTLPYLNLKAGVGLLGGKFASANTMTTSGTQIGLTLDPLDLNTALTISLEPESGDSGDTSHFMADLLPYLEINTLRFMTQGYNSAINYFLSKGLPLLDLSTTIGVPIEHPLAPGSWINLGAELNFGMIATGPDDDNNDGTPEVGGANGKDNDDWDGDGVYNSPASAAQDDEADGLQLIGGLGFDMGFTGTNCLSGCTQDPTTKVWTCGAGANDPASLSWNTTSPVGLFGATSPNGADPVYSIGAGIHQNALSQILFNAYKSGALCLSVDKNTALVKDLVGALPIDIFSTDTFGLLMPSLVDPNKGNLAGKNMRFVIRPTFKNPSDGCYEDGNGGTPCSKYINTPFILAGGPDIGLPATNPYGNAQTGLTVGIPHLTLDLQADTTGTGTWKRIFGLDLATRLSMGVGIFRDTSCNPGLQGPPDTTPNDRCYVTTMAPRITLEADPMVSSFLWYNEAVELVPVGTYNPATPSAPYAQVEGVLSELLPLVLSGALQMDLMPRIDISSALNVGDPTATPPRGIALTTNFVGGQGADFNGLPGDDPEVAAIYDTNMDGKIDGSDVGSTNVAGDTFSLFLKLVEDLDNDCTPAELTATAPPGVLPACRTENYLNANDIWSLLCGDLVIDTLEADADMADILTMIKDMCNAAGFPVAAPPRPGVMVAANYDFLAPDTFILLGSRKEQSIDLMAEYKSADDFGLSPYGGSTLVVDAVDRFSRPDQIQFSYRLDGGAWHHFTKSNTIELPPLLEGYHLVQVASTNVNGVIDDTPATLSFWMDHLPPSIQISGLDGQTRVNVAEPRFQLNVTDFVAPASELKVEYRVDGSAWQAASAGDTIQLAETSEGDHVLEVQASDPAGNGTTASQTFNVDVPENKASGGGCVMVLGASGGGFSGFGLALIALVLGRTLSSRKK